MIRIHKGWWIYRNDTGPVTGKYLAYRYGVRMGGSTLEMLLLMIDQRAEDDQRRDAAWKKSGAFCFRQK